MSAAPRSSSKNKRPPKSMGLRWAIRIVVLLLLVPVAYEAFALWSYRQSLDKLREAVFDRPITAGRLTAESVPALLSGYNQQTQTNSSVEVCWPSLLREYRVWLKLTTKGEVSGLSESAPVANSLAQGRPGNSTVPGGKPQVGMASSATTVNKDPFAPRVTPKNSIDTNDPLAQIEGHGHPQESPWALSPTVGEGVLVCDAFDSDPSMKRFLPGSLIREIGRQSLLISGRDEMGLQTRDASLREHLDLIGNSDRWPLSVVTSIVPAYRDWQTNRQAELIISVLQRTDKGWITHWIRKSPTSEADLYEILVKSFEEYSRAEFPKVLERVGFKKASSPDRRPDHDVWKEVVPRRQNFNEFSQYSAVRRLHQAIRQQGESPELLGELARSYANLGSATQYYWSPCPKVCFARALLYAEREFVQSKGSAAALRDRAYVRALVGLHGTALSDLDQAEKKAPPTGNELGVKSVALLRAFLTSDLTFLSKSADRGEHRQLARYLQLLTIEHLKSKTATIEAAAQVLELTPDCHRALGTLANVTGLSGKKFLAIESDPRFIVSTYGHLATVPGLPTGIREKARDLHRDVNKADNKKSVLGNLLGALRGDREEQAQPLPFAEEHRLRIETIGRLRKEGRPETDRGEPSFASLSYLMQEATFVHSWWMISLFANALGLPADEVLAERLPLTEGHPWQSFLAAHRADGSQIASGLSQMVRNCRLRELEWNAMPVGRFLEQTQFADPFTTPWSSISHHSDAIFADLLIRLHAQNKGYRDKSKHDQLEILKRISPHSLAVIEASISEDPKGNRQKFAEWEEKFQKMPESLEQLGRAWLVLGDIEAGKRCLQKVVKLNPGFESYRSLSQVYFDQGDEIRWANTLLEAVKHPSEGLDAYSLMSEVATRSCKRRDFATAQPFAMKAAESGSGWGLLSAGFVATQLEDWELAEQCLQQIAERYAESSQYWLRWCVLTGRGNRPAAAELAEKYVARLDDNSLIAESTRGMADFILAGQSDRALAVGIQKQKVAGFDVFLHWNVALLADVAGQRPVRDESVKRLLIDLRKDPREVTPGMITFAVKLQDDFARPKSEVNLRELEEAIATLPDDHQANYWFVLGRYLQIRSRKSEAHLCLERAVSTPDDIDEPFAPSQLLAAYYLSQDKQKIPRERRFVQVKLDFPASPGVQTLNDAKAPLLGVQFSADGKLLAAGSLDGLVRVWKLDPSGPQLVATLGRETEKELRWFRLSNDGQFVAIAKTSSSKVSIWSLADKAVKHTLETNQVQVPCGAVSPDGKTLIAYAVRMHRGFDVNGEVIIWDLPAKKELKRIPVTTEILAIEFVPSGREFVTLSREDRRKKTGCVQRWELATAKPRDVSEEPHCQFVQYAFTGDGRQYVLSTAHNRVEVRKSQNDEVVATLFQPDFNGQSAINPRGDLVACGANDGTIRLWRVNDDRIQGELLGNLREIKGLAFSPDGRHLVSVGADTSIRLWTLEQLPKELLATTQRTPVRTIRNSLGMTFVPIAAAEYEGGAFWGAKSGDTSSYPRNSFAAPRHRVRITRGFYLAQHEVTVAQFREFVKATGYVTLAEKSGGGFEIGRGKKERSAQRADLNWKSPGFQQADNHPAVYMANEDAVAFCRWLSEKEKVSYRLPTEAEWEMACRAGTVEPWYFGKKRSDLADHANHADEAFAPDGVVIHGNKPSLDGFEYTAPVGSFFPNPYGLYDIYGNVREACMDWYVEPITSDSLTDPKGPATGQYRGQRGGSFASDDLLTTSATRHHSGILKESGPNPVETVSADNGFRVLREIPESSGNH